MRAIRALTFVILIVPLFAAVLARAQGEGSGSPTFASDEPLKIRIAAPFRQLAEDEEGRPEYDATFEYEGRDGDRVTLDIEVRIRGKSRADPENCSFPPLSLDFPSGGVAGTEFAGQNRLKLVTLCQRDRSYRDYLAKEFLIYKMWNALTDRSFRVRWATVEYVYTDRDRNAEFVEPAFLIEGDWEVAERLGMEVVEVNSIKAESLDAAYTTLLLLFQYLIGNTDWSVMGAIEDDLCCHNGKVIGRPGAEYVVLPYDFDNSGLVNAEYAVPSGELSIQFVTERLYRGFCLMNVELPGAIEKLNSERNRLVEILDDELIRERPRERALRYLESSFEIINNPRRLESRIYDKCRED